jgi:DNA polymerase-1
MRVIKTHQLDPRSINRMEKDWIYNGLDACVTRELFDILLPQLDDYTRATYRFSRDLQGPALEMRLRGVRVDMQRRNEVINECAGVLDKLECGLERLVYEGVGMPAFNWRSNPDRQRLFYDVLRIPVVRRRGRPTTDITAIEKIRDDYLIARQICQHMLAIGTIAKKISVLQTEVDPDDRIRTSYNIAGTSTGRFSSSFSEFGTGGNLQNVEEALRSIFIADKGMKLAKFDAKSGESYVVGALEWNLFGDPTYLDACETGDPHTATARLCWPDLDWTGDLKHDRKIAEQDFYRGHSYRDMCKKLGHGSNYGGRPATLSRETAIPETIVEDFQDVYFPTYPAHQLWHTNVEDRLRADGYLVSLSRRKRWFFGRRNDATTLREAIAFDPQCSLADAVNRGMLQVWGEGIIQMYMHDHDALTVQYPEEKEDKVIPRIFKLLEYPIKLEGGRRLLIPYDCVVGWNRSKQTSDNPNGLRDYTPGDKGRKRV